MRLLLKTFLAFFLLATPLQAQVISYPENKIMGFRGLDTKSTDPTLVDGRATDLMNVKLSSAFDLKKRYGYSRINGSLDDAPQDPPPAVIGIFDTNFSDGTSKTIVFAGDWIYYDNSGTWTQITGFRPTSGKNNQFQCVLALDNAVCTNDTDVPVRISTTPTAVSLDVSDLSDALTKVKVMAWFQNYLILGNTVEAGTERPTRFRWSDVGTIEDYTDDNFVDIATFGGDEIIGFAELYGDLYIFLKKSIWKASLVGGDDVFVFKKVIDGIGAIARDSIQVIQLSDNRSVVFFLDDRKKVLMFNGVSVTDIGTLIQPTLDSINESRLQYAVSTFDGKDYLLCVSDGGSSENDVVFDFQTEIFEWTRHDQIDANAFAQVQEADLKIKTYFGNYDAFVYELDNSDTNSDVDGGSGIVDSVGVVNVSTATGAQILLDSSIPKGTDFTGAIVQITSGTAAGEEAVILQQTSTGLVVTAAFSTTPDSTSVYSIGAIDAYYQTKHYDLGDSARIKSFASLLIFAAEASSNGVDITEYVDFGSALDSLTLDLSPSGSSLWDTALWDVGTWGTTGSKIYTHKLIGNGNFIQYKFENDNIDESFQLYGINTIAFPGDIKQ